MSFFMVIFLAFLIYVSYFKLVFLLFRGKQHNRFFATAVNTFIPVVGSIPVFVMASKYERRVGGIAPKMNDYVLRCIIIALHLASVFLLFAPFFASDGITASGVNVIFGLNIGGVVIFRPVTFLAYVIAFPILSAIVGAIDQKRNIRNVLSYITSLIQSITFFGIALFTESIQGFEATFVLWIYCIIQVVIMLLSFFSLVKVRNEFLANLEQKEEKERIEEEKRLDEELRVSAMKQERGTYKCSKCGNEVVKGTVCSCRKENKGSLDKLMTKEGDNQASDFCVYCKRSLMPGEKCNCEGDGFGITVKPEHSEGRKCKYCGQILIGDSVCVCEKIMKNSVPATEKPNGASYYGGMVTHSSEELENLEKKIEEKFSSVKSSFSLFDSDNK